MRTLLCSSVLLVLSLACAGGEPPPVAPAPAAPDPAPVERPPVEIVLTGDPVLDAFQYDCFAEIPPEDPSAGPDECRALPPLPEVAGANPDCVSNAELCGSGCGTRCADCQRQCASDCDLCKNACTDADCIKFCAEGRASCRLVCMRGQSECARTCGEDIAQCTASAAEQLAQDCPRCDQIRLCFQERVSEERCRPKFAGEDERCFTWCRP